MCLINYETNQSLTWRGSIAIANAIASSKFEIIDIESDLAVKSMTIKEIFILLQKLNSEFKRISYWNKFLPKEFTQIQGFPRSKYTVNQVKVNQIKKYN